MRKGGKKTRFLGNIKNKNRKSKEREGNEGHTRSAEGEWQ
jgi:hypothetical protein